VSFLCTFLNSPTDCGFGEQAKVPRRASIVNIGRDGPTAVRLHTEPGDNNVTGSGSSERNDLTLSVPQTNCYEGQEQWWAHSVLFPDDYVVPPAGPTWNWGIVFDFHDNAFAHPEITPPAQANFHIDAMPNPIGLRIRGYGGLTTSPVEYGVILGPVVKNVWYDFVYHVKWSSGADGFFIAWVNGKKVVNHSGPTLYRGMQCFLKLANYHSAFGQATSVIHDRVIRGTTADAVSLTPLEN